MLLTHQIRTKAVIIVKMRSHWSTRAPHTSASPPWLQLLWFTTTAASLHSAVSLHQCGL